MSERSDSEQKSIKLGENGQPICHTIEDFLFGPISWKILNRINFLLASDTQKDDFVDITLHPKGYLCIKRAAPEVTFGFESRIPLNQIQLPIMINASSDEKEQSVVIIISAQNNQEIIQSIQFVYEEQPDTDLGYSSGLGTQVGFIMSDIEKAYEVNDLLNELINKALNNPTLTFAEFPPYWED